MNTTGNNILTSVIAAIVSLSFISFGQAGNDTGGGGDTTETPIASIRDIYHSINNAHSARLMMAYAWQRQYPKPNSTPKDNTNYFESLFKKFILQYNLGPCIDSENKTKEGSADVSKMEICLSESEIFKRKIPLKLLDTKVAGLYAHEAAHLIGLDEKEAVTIQERVEASLAQTSFSFEKLRHSRSFYLHQLVGEAFEGWQTILDHEDADELSLCDNTTEISNLIFETNGLLYNEQKQYGVIHFGDEAYRLTSPTEDYLWEAFRVRGHMVGVTCKAKSSFSRNEYERLFSINLFKPLPVEKAMCLFNTPPVCDTAKMTPTNVPDILYINRGNRKNVEDELQRMETIRQLLLKSFRQSIWLGYVFK